LIIGRSTGATAFVNSSTSLDVWSAIFLVVMILTGLRRFLPLGVVVQECQSHQDKPILPPSSEEIGISRALLQLRLEEDIVHIDLEIINIMTIPIASGPVVAGAGVIDVRDTKPKRRVLVEWWILVCPICLVDWYDIWQRDARRSLPVRALLA
jgi:hypothetical protein